MNLEESLKNLFSEKFGINVEGIYAQDGRVTIEYAIISPEKLSKLYDFLMMVFGSERIASRPITSLNPLKGEAIIKIPYVERIKILFSSLFNGMRRDELKIKYVLERILDESKEYFG